MCCVCNAQAAKVLSTVTYVVVKLFGVWYQASESSGIAFLGR
jgi:hypothetical protein